MADKKLIYETKEALYARALRAMNEESMIIQHAFKIENYEKAAELLEQLGDYEDAPALAGTCREKAQLLRTQEQEYQYSQALRQQENAALASEYDKAAELFGRMPGYQDADARKQQCLMESARLVRKRQRSFLFGILAVLALIAVGWWFFHSALWGKMKADIMDEVYIDPALPLEKQEQIAIGAAKTGDVVSFGQMEWVVLAQEDTSALLIAKPDDGNEALSYHAYHDAAEEIAWKACALRAWLNTAFLSQQFTEQEQALLLTMQCAASDNPAYDIPAGEATEDRVTILSSDEAAQYQGILRKLKSECWLRTPGHTLDTAAYLNARADVIFYGLPVESSVMRVCPVIRVSLEENKRE